MADRRQREYARLMGAEHYVLDGIRRCDMTRLVLVAVVACAVGVVPQGACTTRSCWWPGTVPGLVLQHQTGVMHVLRVGDATVGGLFSENECDDAHPAASTPMTAAAVMAAVLVALMVLVPLSIAAASRPHSPVVSWTARGSAAARDASPLPPR